MVQDSNLTMGGWVRPPLDLSLGWAASRLPASCFQRRLVEKLGTRNYASKSPCRPSYQYLCRESTKVIL